MGVTRYTYDSLSRVTSVTDGNNKRIDYTYDKLDRVVSISVHDGAALQTMVYDALGSLTTRTYGAVITRFTYDTYPSSRQITSAARSQGGTTETVVIVLVGAMGLWCFKVPASAWSPSPRHRQRPTTTRAARTDHRSSRETHLDVHRRQRLVASSTSIITLADQHGRHSARTAP